MRPYAPYDPYGLGYEPSVGWDSAEVTTTRPPAPRGLLQSISDWADSQSAAYQRSLNQVRGAVDVPLPSGEAMRPSAVNMLLGGLGTAARWLQGDTSQLRPEDMLAPVGTGLGSAMVAARARPRNLLSVQDGMGPVPSAMRQVLPGSTVIGGDIYELGRELPPYYHRSRHMPPPANDPVPGRGPNGGALYSDASKSAPARSLLTHDGTVANRTPTYDDWQAISTAKSAEWKAQQDAIDAAATRIGPPPRQSGWWARHGYSPGRRDFMEVTDLLAPGQDPMIRGLNPLNSIYSDASRPALGMAGVRAYDERTAPLWP